MQDSADINNINYRPTGLTNSNYSIVNSTILFRVPDRKPDAFRSSTVIFDAKLNTYPSLVADNEISVRWSSAPHSGESIVQCFDLGFGVKTGKTRLRYEHQHPEYTDALAVGNIVGSPLDTKDYDRLEFVKLDILGEKTPLFEVYQTTVGSGGNDRIKLFSFTDPAHFVEWYPNGCEIAIKPKENFENIDIREITVKEIEPV
jgi:hypothetical protein